MKTMMKKVMEIVKKHGNTIDAGSTSNCREKYNIIGFGIAADMQLVAIIDGARPCSSDIDIYLSEERIVAMGNYDYVFRPAKETTPYNKCIEWANNVNKYTEFDPLVRCKPIIAIVSVEDNTDMHLMMDGIKKAAELQEERDERKNAFKEVKEIVEKFGTKA